MVSPSMTVRAMQAAFEEHTQALEALLPPLTGCVHLLGRLTILSPAWHVMCACFISQPAVLELKGIRRGAALLWG